MDQNSTLIQCDGLQSAAGWQQPLAGPAVPPPAVLATSQPHEHALPHRTSLSTSFHYMLEAIQHKIHHNPSSTDSNAPSAGHYIVFRLPHTADSRRGPDSARPSSVPVTEQEKFEVDISTELQNRPSSAFPPDHRAQGTHLSRAGVVLPPSYCNQEAMLLYHF